MRSLLLGAIFAALLITRTLDTDAFRAQHGLRPLAYSACACRASPLGAPKHRELPRNLTVPAPTNLTP